MKKIALAAFALLIAQASYACFGTELKISVPPSREGALAAYTTGYFVEEKTGVAPDFIEESDWAASLLAGKADLAIVPEGSALPEGTVSRSAGTPGKLGKSLFAIRAEVLDDIRFTTVEKALGLLPGFFSGKAYLDATSGALDPKKAARKAVLDGN